MLSSARNSMRELSEYFNLPCDRSFWRHRVDHLDDLGVDFRFVKAVARLGPRIDRVFHPERICNNGVAVLVRNG